MNCEIFLNRTAGGSSKRLPSAARTARANGFSTGGHEDLVVTIPGRESAHASSSCTRTRREPARRRPEEALVARSKQLPDRIESIHEAGIAFQQARRQAPQLGPL